MSCGYRQQPDLSLIKVLLAVFLIACMTLVSPLVKSRLDDTMKEITIGMLETSFKEIQHPGGTEQIALQKEVGQFAGDNQKCDFFIGEVRSYTGTPENIQTFYAGQKVKDFGDVRVVMLENNSVPETEKTNLPGNLNSLSQWNLPPAAKGPLYLVYVFSVDNDTYNSLQCH